MSFPHSRFAACASVLLISCGGGGGNPDTARPQLHAELVATGTYLHCQDAPGSSIELVRTTAGIKSTSSINCPSSRVLPGDYVLSQWTLQRKEVIAATETTPETVVITVLAATATTLPSPTLIPNGDRWVVLKQPQLAGGSVPGLLLQLVDQDDTVITSIENPTEVQMSSVETSPSAGHRWRWAATSAGVAHVSPPVEDRTLVERNLGFWGAMAVGDTSGDARPELLGMTTTDEGAISSGYATLGLQALFTDRDFRDVRLADLNNDGLDDVVANVYGAGCTLIGIRRSGGGYDLSEPRRADGSCIGGHGETILIADFDSDGLLDMLLPAYERFDLLQNQGNGTFVEVAEDLGITYPDYMPRVEGGAAVDINLDGAPDIVIANEVLINDGAGRFTPLPSPFGSERVPDEGMSIFDLDGDGFYDIVKNDPFRGLRAFWGNPDRQTFSDSGWLFGGERVLNTSFGLSVGYLSGNWLPDVVYAGGAPAGLPPRLCVQDVPRQLNCLDQVFEEHANEWQDLLMITDLDGDGSSELVARYGSLRSYSAAAVAQATTFRIDLRDAQAFRNQHGRSMRATCAVDDSLLGIRFVDGGNGYMAQGDYVVSFSSPWCPSIWLDVATTNGMRRFGPLLPGTHQVQIEAS